MLSRLFKKFANRLNTPIIRKINSNRDKIEQNRMLVANQLILALKSREISGLPEAEFKVFSQWG
jgi:hypothetical protein